MCQCGYNKCGNETLGNLAIPGPTPYRTPESYIGGPSYDAWLNEGGGWVSPSIGSPGGYDPFGIPDPVTGGGYDPGPVYVPTQAGGAAQTTSTPIVNTMAPPLPGNTAGAAIQIDGKTAIVAAVVGLVLVMYAAK